MLRSALVTVAALMALLTGCAGLNMLRSSVARAVVRGKDLTLVCEVDPDGKRIYQFKWYKDGQEFYRYQPGEDPPGRAFNEVTGINVNVAKSDDSRVVLERVDLDAEGRYACEVTTEYPFDTVTANGTITVVEAPLRDPETSSEDTLQRDSGELVSLNCTSSASRPAVNLTWLINGEKTGSRWTTQYPVPVDDSGLQMAALGLDFRLSEEHFRLGVVSLKCIAELFDVYYGRAEVKVQRRSMAQRSSTARGVRSAAGGVAAPTLLPVTLISGLAFVLTRGTIVVT